MKKIVIFTMFLFSISMLKAQSEVSEIYVSCGASTGDLSDGFVGHRIDIGDILLNVVEPTFPIVSDMVTIHPNPTTEGFYISKKLAYASLSIQLLDIKGTTTLLQTTITDSKHYVDLSSFANGTYLLLLEDKKSGNKQTLKVIKD